MPNDGRYPLNPIHKSHRCIQFPPVLSISTVGDVFITRVSFSTRSHQTQLAEHLEEDDTDLQILKTSSSEGIGEKIEERRIRFLVSRGLLLRLRFHSNREMIRLSIAVVSAILLLHVSATCVAAAQVPAMFVFGDSLVDSGNNNFLESMAKANYMPYGIDFTGWPTGRFTNGRTVADFLGEKLGLPYIPPYADPRVIGSRILTGVNFASAAAGILDETGQNYGERFSLNQQVLNFQNTVNQLRYQLGGGLAQHLSNSIAFLVFGSNDYVNNYLMPSMYPSSRNYSPEAFANLLLNHYTRQLLALHSMGLRKFLIAGVGPLGCIPNQRAAGKAPPGRCVNSVNVMLGTFNEGLRALVQQLNSDHPGAMFVYGNTYGGVGDILNNPSAYGFSVWDKGCCGIQSSQAITCLPLAIPCPNRSQYVFWDAFHTTQSVNAVLGQRAFTGPPNDCYPMNVQQLAAFQTNI